MFTINKTSTSGAQISADAVLTPDDFRAIAKQAGSQSFVARKSGLIAARTATATERVDTHWNGKESTNTAKPGDRVVTSLDKTGKPLIDADGHKNIYVILADKFVALYELANVASPLGSTYRARGTVEAIHFAGGFEIIAPWGETQRAPSGYLILNGQDVYGNNAETFEASYEREMAR